MTDQKIPRRGFLKGTGAAATAVVSGLAGGTQSSEAATDPSLSAAAPETQAPPAPISEPSLTLNATEFAFIIAAVDTLIPADDLSPSGAECGVAVFIDRQLAGAYGSGARLYRDGPFLKGTPEQGYQLPLTPREFFRAGIAAANAWTGRAYGKPFDALDEKQRIAALQALEHGKADLQGFESKGFFDALLNIAMEGFFADPIYGGNRDKAAWRMIGYPGLPATYREAIVAYHGKRFETQPQSIADFN